MTEAWVGEISMLDEALALVGEGFHVLPCHAGSKRAAVDDWQHRVTNDPEIVREWWSIWPDANVAIVPERSGHVVLDLDNKGDRRGIEAMRALELEHEPLPETRAVRTPSGGLHLYFRGRAPFSNDAIAPGIEVRQGNHYVLAAGEVDGKRYETLKAPIAELSDWLRDLAIEHAAPKREPLTAKYEVEPDLPVNLGWMEGLLAVESVPPDGERNRRLHAVACELKDHAIAEGTALARLREWIAPSGLPDDEIEAAVHSAYTNSKNAFGCKALRPAQEAFAAYLATLPTIADAPSLVPPEPISFTEVLSRAAQPLREIIPGLIERGTTTFLSAPGGSHKSRLALQWGLCIEAGKPVFGRAVERATFVYLSYEDHADEVTRRAQAIAARLSLPMANGGQYWDLTADAPPLAIIADGVELQPFWHRLRAYLHAISGHKFLVIDSTYNALQFVGAAKINESAVKQGIELLNRLCRETDSTVLVLWHPSQAGQERGDASGWSVAWHNTPRSRVSITAIKDTADAFELKVEKRNNGRKADPITLHWSGGALLPRAETDIAEQRSRFHQACVTAAIAAAESGQAIQTQRRLSGWIVDQIERECGRRPTERAVKEELATALHLGAIRYVRGSKERVAGYYPFDEREALALATSAKRDAKAGRAIE